MILPLWPRLPLGLQSAGLAVGLLGLALMAPPLMAQFNLSTLADQRAQFLAAERALDAGQWDRGQALAAQLTDYPLHPYLESRLLQRRLAAVAPAAMRAFLAKAGDSPPGQTLHRAWLTLLANQQRWRAFFADYPKDLASPPEDEAWVAMDCWRRQGLLALNRPREALSNVEALWLHGRSRPNPCDPILDRWRAQGGLTRELVWGRFILAMEAGEISLARYLKRYMPAADRPAADHWFAVRGDPGSLLRRALPRGHAYTPALVGFGLARWGRRDSVAAAAAFDRLAGPYGLSDSDDPVLGKALRQLALYVASRGHPSALDRLMALPPHALDRDVAEWRVRVALQRRDWNLVLATTAGLPPTLGEEAMVRYWRARALAQGGDTAAAAVLYRSLATQRDYYGFLAADHMNLPYRLNHRPVTITPRDVDALAARPAFQRVREFEALERWGPMAAEWRTAVASLDEKGLMAAATLAHRWDWHHRAIVTLARARYWDDLDLRFPTRHREILQNYAQSQQVDPAWAFAILRQESAFHPEIRSSAGALGLMQIMPATGRQIARQLGVPWSSSYLLHQPAVNIRFGVHYLGQNTRSLQGSPLLATAAYNAGPGRVRQWLPEGET
ncbi:MAG: transglycosylase SLT domain-containing protein, partial [Candidatus Competibacterales bacterium]